MASIIDHSEIKQTVLSVRMNEISESLDPVFVKLNTPNNPKKVAYPFNFMRHSQKTKGKWLTQWCWLGE